MLSISFCILQFKQSTSWNSYIILREKWRSVHTQGSNATVLSQKFNRSSMHLTILWALETFPSLALRNRTRVSVGYP